MPVKFTIQFVVVADDGQRVPSLFTLLPEGELCMPSSKPCSVPRMSIPMRSWRSITCGSGTRNSTRTRRL